MYPFGGVKQKWRRGAKVFEYAMAELSQIKFIGIRPGRLISWAFNVVR